MWEPVSTGVCSGDEGYRSKLTSVAWPTSWLLNDNEGKLFLAKGVQNMHLFWRDSDAKRTKCISMPRGVELIKPY